MRIWLCAAIALIALTGCDGGSAPDPRPTVSVKTSPSFPSCLSYFGPEDQGGPCRDARSGDIRFPDDDPLCEPNGIPRDFYADTDVCTSERDLSTP